MGTARSDQSAEVAEFARLAPLAQRIADSAPGIIPADRGDVRQEAMLGLWRAILRYDPERGGLDHYAVVLIQGAIKDFRRRNWRAHGREVRMQDWDRVPGPGGDQVDRVLDAKRTLERLPERKRQAILLRLQGYSGAAVARRLRVTTVTVWRWIKAMKILIPILFAVEVLAQTAGTITAQPAVAPQAAVVGSVRAAAGQVSCTMTGNIVPATAVITACTVKGVTFGPYTVPLAPGQTYFPTHIFSGDSVTIKATADAAGKISVEAVATPAGGTEGKTSAPVPF